MPPRAQRALDEEGVQAFRRQALRQLLVQVDGAVAGPAHRQRGQQILGDRGGGHAADRLQRRAAHHRARTAAERHAPGVAAGRHLIEEQPLLVRQVVGDLQVQLHRVLVEEVLRGLDDAHIRRLEQPGGARQEGPVRHEVGVEHRHQIAVGVGEGVVHVARLGVRVVRAGDVADPAFPTERREPAAPAVVQHVHAEIGVGHRLGADDRLLQHLQPLVVGRDQHVHAGVGAAGGERGLSRVRAPRSALGAGHDQKEHRDLDERDQLDRVDRPDPGRFHGRAVERQHRVAQTPAQIAQRDQGEHTRDQRARPIARLRQAGRDADEQAQDGQARRPGGEVPADDRPAAHSPAVDPGGVHSNRPCSRASGLLSPSPSAVGKRTSACRPTSQ